MKTPESTDTASAVAEKPKAPKLPAPPPLPQGERMDLPQSSCRLMAGFNRANLDLSAEFIDSIRTNGVLMPVLARPLAKPEKGITHEIFAGARRWKANAIAGALFLPAIVMPAVTDAQALNFRLIENLQREGLTPLDEARQYEETLATTGQTIEQLAAAVGVKRSTIFERRRLLKATPEVQKALAKGELEASVAGLLAAIPDPKSQLEAMEAVMEGDWRSDEEPMSFRQARDFIREQYMVNLKGALFDRGATYQGTIAGRKTGDGELALVGSCNACPRRSGNMEGSNQESPDICTYPPCFAAKKEAHVTQKLKDAAARGQEVHGLKDAPKFFQKYGGVKDSYVALADRCDALGYNWDKTWKITLGKHAPTPIVAADEKGDLHELLTKASALTALKAAGKKPVSITAPSDSYVKQRAANQKKTEVLTAAAEAVVPRILDTLVKDGKVPDKLWSVLANGVYAHTSYSAAAAMSRRRGWGAGGFPKWMKTQPKPIELLRFVLESLLLSQVVEDTYNAPKFARVLKLTAEVAGVPLEVPKEEKAEKSKSESTAAPVKKPKPAKSPKKARAK